MASVFGVSARHGNHMADANANVTIAARADVALGRLIWLNEPHVDVIVVIHLCRLDGQPTSAHATSAATTTSAPITMA